MTPSTYASMADKGRKTNVLKLQRKNTREEGQGNWDAVKLCCTSSASAVLMYKRAVRSLAHQPLWAVTLRDPPWAK
eukprot:3746234-Amphidinium_carterae.1